ncbi:hypothetical protein SAMN04487948_111114 [Halogranum amylolyticum]|uniref:Polyketide cyclase / dehydrase and lipid transport n=1 Tax=Halogranum amylolyticum TaxID=660520 RepID=A0A1H8UMD4_9EURY|nr:hypothetical protein [Halogranum amylolyticum]SEP03768.1 hypothetical protein SAMN04487948_111114 [Halogranum amylolyticum]
MTTARESDQLASDNTASTTIGRWRRRIGWTTGVALLVAAYWKLLRPRMLNWGATPMEVSRSLPGDDLLADAGAESTMAITIDARADAIWPWLCQLGQEQGGFYSYELAENLVGLDIHNADRIVPEWQDLAVGDRIRLGGGDQSAYATLEVATLDPERSLVLRTPDDPTRWVWSFVLDPLDETTTRLLIRSRIRLPENPVVRVASLAALDPVSSLMTYGMLQGIRSRAERLARTGRTETGSDPSQE